MSYIVPRDKPKRCAYCNFFNREYRDCKLQRVVYDSLDKQYADCPLIELPPHGRLIDADKIEYTHAVARNLFDGHNWNELVVTKDEIEDMPTIQPEPHEIGYQECANALLKMWMDNVLTDGDYYRITDKLNKKWGKTELPEPYTEQFNGVMDGRN